MPIEVIGRNVEYDRDLGVESTSGFELKAGNFKNDDRIWFGFRNQRNGRSSYISADGGGVAARSDDLAGESGCSSLAVRTSDSHDWSLQVLCRELNLSDDFFAQSARLHQGSSIHRHTRADHDQVLPAESALTMASGLDRNSLVEQNGDFVAQLVLGFRIRDTDASPPFFEKQGGGHAGLAEANHQHAFAVYIHVDRFYHQRTENC